MSYALITGSISKEPETKLSKANREYICATVRVRDGKNMQSWRVMAFSDTAIAEIRRLKVGDALSTNLATVFRSDRNPKDLKMLNDAENFPPTPTMLPVWFTERMMHDHFAFGLLMNNGEVIAISHISEITPDASGTLWLDVELLPPDFAPNLPAGHPLHGRKLFTALNSRKNATIRADAVVAAFELADT